MTDKIVRDSNRFDFVILGKVDHSKYTREPKFIDMEYYFNFIVDTLIKGDIQTTEGFEIKGYAQEEDSLVLKSYGDSVEIIRFKSGRFLSDPKFKQAKSIMISLEHPTGVSGVVEHQICMFGDKDFKVVDNQADPDQKVRHSIGNLAHIELDQKQFQKTLKGIRRKARK